MRKLATIQAINELYAIEGKDRIELAKVGGWNSIVRKGYKIGDLVVYFENDSHLPLEPRYEFLRAKNELEGRILIKPNKMFNIVSHGLAMDIKDFPELADMKLEVGMDLTELLNIKKYESEEAAGDAFHSGISKTDELRYQSDNSLYKAMLGKSYYITEKIDGMSTTIVKEDGKISLYGKNTAVPMDEGDYAKAVGAELLSKLESCKGDNFFIQGESYGEGIRGNKLRIKGKDFRFFNLGRLENGRGRLIGYNQWSAFLEEMGIKDIVRSVKVLEEGDSFNYKVEDLQALSTGEYEGAAQREGVVIRSKDTYTQYNEAQVSFKVINDEYLVKE